MSQRATVWVFTAVGVLHVAAGLVMLFAPGAFYDGIATFQPRNDHYIRDLGTFYVALGIGFSAAARRPAWRGVVLVVAIVEYALHTANHLYDLGYPAEDWVGPATTALLAAGLAALALLAYVVSRGRRAP